MRRPSGGAISGARGLDRPLFLLVSIEGSKHRRVVATDFAIKPKLSQKGQHEDVDRQYQGDVEEEG